MPMLCTPQRNGDAQKSAWMQGSVSMAEHHASWPVLKLENQCRCAQLGPLHCKAQQRQHVITRLWPCVTQAADSSPDGDAGYRSSRIFLPIIVGVGNEQLQMKIAPTAHPQCCMPN